MTKTNTNHFETGARVEALFCDVTLTWLVGRVLGYTDSGLVVTKLDSGLVVTRHSNWTKHLETCKFCCTVKEG